MTAEKKLSLGIGGHGQEKTANLYKISVGPIWLFATPEN
jgi:hypothetical protein